MRAKWVWICAIVVGVVAAPATLYAQPYPVGTAFAYQGQLKEGGSPYSGTAQMILDLYDDPAAGTLLASVGPLSVPVTDGLFTVTVEFGEGVFTGEARWLEIVVNGTTLSPRQELKPAPYALALPGLWTQQNASSPNLIGGYVGNYVESGVAGATISGGGNSQIVNRVLDNGGVVGGGTGNQAGSHDTDPTTAPNSTVAGGKNNTASASRATVGGGSANTASGDFATVAGGAGNQASHSYAIVGGGWANTASGTYTVVGGGHENTASGNYAAVGGGYSNDATGMEATVSGGYDNTASGDFSAVPGGIYNQASGISSFAAGRRAQALHDGAFVWGDSTDEDFASTANDQFLVRASGGVGIGTTNPRTDVEIEGDTGLRVTTGEHWNVFGEFRHAFSGGLQINANAGGGYADIRLQTDGTTRLFVESQGNVGVGTTSPEDVLHVAGASPTDVYAGQLRIEGTETDGAADTGGGITFMGHDGNIRRIWATVRGMKENDSVESTASYLAFGTRVSGADVLERMRISSTGDVGIGTDTPAAKLHIDGTPGVDGLMFPDGTLQTTAATGGGGGNTLDQAYDQGGPGAGRIITADAGPVYIAGSDGLRVTGTVSAFKGEDVPGVALSLERRTSSSPIWDNITEIDSNAINAYRESAERFGSTLSLNNDSDGDVLIAEGGGYVGIGEPSPTAMLQIGGTAGVDGVKFPDGTLQTTAAGGSASVPIGAVIDWWRPNDAFPVPDGYQICDGSVVNDPQSPFDGETLPNLRNRFVRGAPTVDDIGEMGGAQNHSHAITGHVSLEVVTMNASDSNEVAPWPGNISFALGNHRHTCDPHRHDAGTLENEYRSHLPPYVGLLKIMRIR